MGALAAVALVVVTATTSPPLNRCLQAAVTWEARANVERAHKNACLESLGDAQLRLASTPIPPVRDIRPTYWELAAWMAGAMGAGFLVGAFALK